MSEFVVVIGRLRPIGQAGVIQGEYERTCPRFAVKLEPDGKPLCVSVQLERIVPQISVTKEQAAEEFLRLTEETK